MDFATIAADLVTTLTPVIAASATVWTLILGAKAGVRFFKSMVK
jgi:hypothetical protein